MVRRTLPSANGPARTCSGPVPCRLQQPGMDILGMGGHSIMVCKGTMDFKQILVRMKLTMGWLMVCEESNSSESYSYLKWISYMNLETECVLSS